MGNLAASLELVCQISVFRAYSSANIFVSIGASSAVLGFILTLINSARMYAGKSSIGFINPTIYKYPYVLNDIESGSNMGCGTMVFMTVEGWDPVTGLGTPNFPKPLALYLSLP